MVRAGPPMLRLVGVALLVGLPPLMTAEKVSACMCPEYLTIGEEMALSEAVFAGRVESWEEFDWQVEAWVVLVEFEVARVWKGPAYETRWVGAFPSDGFNCGAFSFDQGAEYLVYAATDAEISRTYPDTLWAFACERTRLLEAAEEDLDYLGPGQPPVLGWVAPRPEEQALPRPPDAGIWTLRGSTGIDGWTFAVGAGLAFLLAGLGRASLTRRR